MEKIIDVACVKNEIYKDSIYNLSKILVLKMSETFDDKQYEIYIHDDFAEVVWHTKMQVMAEDLTDIGEKTWCSYIVCFKSGEWQNHQSGSILNSRRKQYVCHLSIIRPIWSY